MQEGLETLSLATSPLPLGFMASGALHATSYEQAKHLPCPGFGRGWECFTWNITAVLRPTPMGRGHTSPGSPTPMRA